MNKKDHLYLYSTEKISKALIILAIPSVLSSLINLIYNLINSVYIGMLNNTAMVAAITIASPVTTMIYAFGSAIGIGSSSYISRQLGGNELDNSKVTVKTAMTSGVLISFVIMAYGVFGLKPTLALLTNDPEVLNFAYQYSFIIFMGSMTITMKQIIVNLLKTEADILFPMYMMLISVILCVIVNPILMFDWGFNMGIKGAALATVSVDTLTLLALLWRQCYRSKYVRWRIGNFGIDRAALGEIVNVGSAVFVRNLLPSFSAGVFAKSAGMFGTTFVAGVGIGKRATSFALTAIQGMAHGFLPFAAYNYGARNRQRLKESITLLIRDLTIYAFFMSGVFLLFAPSLARIYTPDAQAIHYGSLMLRYYTISLVNQGAYNVLLIILQAFGRNKDSIMVSLARGAFFYIPIVYFLPRLYGEIGIYLTQPITDWMTLLTILFITRHIIKELLIK